MADTYSRERHGSRPLRRPISPTLWGRTIWDALFYMVLGYDQQDPHPDTAASMRSLLWSLQHVLPCGLCREHLADIYRTIMPLTPEVFASQDSLGRYLVNLRDYIACHHADKKPDRLYHTFPDDVLHLLQPRNQWPCYLYVLLGGLLAAVIMYLYRSKQ